MTRGKERSCRQAQCRLLHEPPLNLVGSKHTINTQENPEVSKETIVGALKQQAEGL